MAAVRIVIPGSGQVGAILSRAFADDEVIVIGRDGPVAWDGRTLGPWAEAIDNADAGFAFDYPEWPAAARDLVAEWRR